MELKKKKKAESKLFIYRLHLSPLYSEPWNNQHYFPNKAVSKC